MGCLRCMNEYHEFVVISPNPDRLKLGDSYFTSNYVDQLTYESETGMVPVKGAGYRGKFGGQGWDGMWTDMSEIVRPTRDGIHGREFISTSVDIGTKPNFLIFNATGQSEGEEAHTFSLPVPFIFDALPVSVESGKTWRCAGRGCVGGPDAVGRAGFIPGSLWAGRRALRSLDHPGRTGLISQAISFTPRLLELEGWDASTFAELQNRFPHTLICLRVPFGTDLMELYLKGVRIFHLTADYHGRSADGRFILDLIRQAHQGFVEAAVRDEVTLIGSGGLIAAEHLPKAIICGLDLIALDTPLLVAMQANFQGECLHPHGQPFYPAQESFPQPGERSA